MPYYYKHFMWLDKKEWEKLKSRADPPNTPCVKDDPYVKALIDQSQEWIKTWPDSVEGHVERVRKQEGKHHDIAEVKAVKAFIKQRKNDGSKRALAKARQLIFERSSYGKQLLSALLASKVIEEREAQIAFKKEIAKEQIELEKKRDHEELYFNKTDPMEQEKSRKKKNVLFALENKCMYETKKSKEQKEKEEEARLEREDAARMKELLDLEKQEEKLYIKAQEDLVKKYEQDVLNFREAKLKRDMENNKKIEKAKIEVDHRVNKIKKLQQHYNTAKLESEAAKLNYKLIEKIENEKRKRFEDFVEMGIKRHEDAIMKKEQDELIKQKNEDKVKTLLRKEQQQAMEGLKLSRCNQIRCSCDRQCVIARSLGERRPNRNKLISQDELKPAEKKVHFLSPCRKLINELRQREKEPTPWSGLSDAHAQFAEQAACALAECKHKTMARKVIDEYRKVNNLSATTLPVKNYET